MRGCQDQMLFLVISATSSPSANATTYSVNPRAHFESMVAPSHEHYPFRPRHMAFARHFSLCFDFVSLWSQPRCDHFQHRRCEDLPALVGVRGSCVGADGKRGIEKQHAVFGPFRKITKGINSLLKLIASDTPMVWWSE